jgi:tripartite-type tricarboxylate transporter receptor subunit TctC
MHFHRPNSSVRRQCLAWLIGAALAPSVWAQQAYPAKPVTLVVAFAPGGIADQAARAVSQSLGEALGQPVVIDNKGGAGGNIGAATVARAPSDGYTLLVTTTSVAVNPALYAKPGYRLEELAPVGQIAASANAIVANPALGVKTLPAALEKARQAKFSFGSPGNGSTSHLTGEYIFNTVGHANVVHAAYRGGALAVGDAIGGQIQFAVAPIPVVLQHVKAGKLVALAVTGGQRYAEWPDVATVGESVAKGYTDETWVGLFAPAGTPAAVVDTLNRKLGEVLKRPDVVAQLRSAGLESRADSVSAFQNFVKQEAAKWARVATDTRIKLE